MDTYMHKIMASVVSLEKTEIIRSQEFMPSKARLKLLEKMIILGPKTAILGPQFCRILVVGPHFWWSGGPGPRAPLDPPLVKLLKSAKMPKSSKEGSRHSDCKYMNPSMSDVKDACYVQQPAVSKNHHQQRFSSRNHFPFRLCVLMLKSSRLKCVLQFNF